MPEKQDERAAPLTTKERSEALLAQYGGEKGPTGHADAGKNGEPVSLASFIGGKAKAPRLGQLAGNGRTSVPEAALADETEYRKLPGLAKPDGSMAKLMEQRHRELFPEEAKDKEAESVRDTDEKTIDKEPKRAPDVKTAEPKKDAPLKEEAKEAKEAIDTKEAKDSKATDDVAKDTQDTKATNDTAKDAKATKATNDAANEAKSEDDTKATTKPRQDAAPTTQAPEKTKDAPQDVPAPLPKRSTSGKEIVVLISGSGSNLQAIIDATCGATPAIPNAQIVRVISNRMTAYGLKRAKNVDPPIPTNVHSLKTYQNRNPGKTREDYDLVLAERVLGDGKLPDLIVLAGFMHIVSETFLSALGHKTSLASPPAFAKRPAQGVPIINLHPALPGAFDGANAIDRAYEAFQKGEIKHTGIMVHEVVAEVDRGAPILVQEVPIHAGESLDELETRMHAVEHQLIVKATAKVLADEPKTIAPPTPRAEKTIATPKLDTSAVERPRGKVAPEASADTVLVYLAPSELLEPLSTFAPQVYEDDLVVAKRGDQSILWRGVRAPAVLPSAVKQALGKTYETVHQGAESPAFLRLLRGPLITFQGSRNAKPSASQLFLVRGSDAALFVDQVPMTTRSLCSAFSAVACTPSRVYVWHGKGSDKEQRLRAVQYAGTRTKSAVIEMDEATASRDWLRLFPAAPYASGWHWRHFSTLPRAQRGARLYVSPDASDAVPFTPTALRADRVALVDAGLEVYVLIGRDARGAHAQIKAALQKADTLADAAQTARGGRIAMRPAIHVLTFPTAIPSDLRILSRAPWDDAHMQGDGDATRDATLPLQAQTPAQTREQLVQLCLSPPV